MPYTTKKAACGSFLLIPGLMVMIAGRLLFLLDSGSQPDSFPAIIAESIFWGGGLAVVVGVILYAKGVPETKKARRILEVVLEKKEVAISEISTQTGFSTEYVRKVISDLMASGYLYGFLEDDCFVSAKAKDSISQDSFHLEG